MRPAVVDDLPQIVAMDRDLFSEHGTEEDPAIIRARLEVFPAGCVVLEERADGRPARFVGYLTTEKWADAREPTLDEDPRVTHKPDGRVLNITTLAVGRADQRGGLGARLLAFAEDLARREGCAEIILETEQAERFYLRHGYETLGERRQRNAHLIVMRKRLASVVAAGPP
ncbi:MAG: GNAT family N-acetyltransferase [Anaerolineae bacterium]